MCVCDGYRLPRHRAGWEQDKLQCQLRDVTSHMTGVWLGALQDKQQKATASFGSDPGILDFAHTAEGLRTNQRGSAQDPREGHESMNSWQRESVI